MISHDIFFKHYLTLHILIIVLIILYLAVQKYIHMHIHIYTYIYICVCVCVCVCVCYYMNIINNITFDKNALFYNTFFFLQTYGGTFASNEKEKKTPTLLWPTFAFPEKNQTVW